jgi:hypothetical protein
MDQLESDMMKVQEEHSADAFVTKSISATTRTMVREPEVFTCR